MTTKLIEFDCYTWDDVNKLCIELAKHLCAAGSTITFPWNRGGYIVAGILSHYGCTLANSAAAADVIVDDIADTGRTMATLFKQDAAVLIVRKGCVPYPTFAAKVIEHKNYVLFPWQDEETERREIATGGYSTVRGKDKE